MGHKSETKEVRKQLRNIFQELAPEVLSQEVVEKMYRKLEESLNIRLTALETQVRDVLERLDKRQQDTLGYLIRAATTPVVPNTPMPEQKDEKSDTAQS